MPLTRRTGRCATAVLALTMVTAGCGSVNHSSSATSTGQTRASTPAGTGAYINAVTRLHATVANASSTFFHAPRAGMHAQTKALEHAYAEAAADLQALATPRAAAGPAQGLRAAWQDGAQRLATVLAHHPFDYGRAWASAAQTGQTSEQAFGTLLTIP